MNIKNRLLLALLTSAGILVATSAHAESFGYRVPYRLPVDSPVATVSFDKAAMNFGTVTAGTSVTQSLVVTNTSKVDIPAVEPVFSPAGLFSIGAGSTCASLPAKASCTLVIQASPTAQHPLTNGGSVTIANATAALNGGTFIPNPAASLSLGTLAFGDQAYGTTSAPQSVTLSNSGNVLLTLGSISSSGDFTSTHNCTASLGVGASCIVNTAYAPTALGAAQGTLTLLTSVGTKTVSLTGNGIKTTPSLSSTSLALGTVIIGDSATSAVVTLTNISHLALTGLTLQPPSGFSVVNSTCGATLAANGSCTFQVSFTPSAVQSYAGNLTVSATNANSQTVSLTGSGSGGVDPAFSSVSLLLHFDGTNGSKVFTDQVGHTVSVTGNPIISSAQSKFGGTSAYFDGSSYLTVNMGKGLGADYTVEFWIYALDTRWSGVFNSRSGNTSDGIDISSQAEATTLGALFLQPTSSVTKGAWHHIAITRYNNISYQFVDGALKNSMPGSDPYNGDPYMHNWTGVHIGTSAYGAFTGYLDDLRVTPGVARYTSSFAVPTKAFPNQ